MVTLIGYIKGFGVNEIVEFARMNCITERKAVDIAEEKCRAKQWHCYQIKY